MKIFVIGRAINAFVIIFPLKRDNFSEYPSTPQQKDGFIGGCALHALNWTQMNISCPRDSQTKTFAFKANHCSTRERWKCVRCCVGWTNKHAQRIQSTCVGSGELHGELEAWSHQHRRDLMKPMRPLVDESCEVIVSLLFKSPWMTLANALPSSTLQYTYK